MHITNYEYRIINMNYVMFINCIVCKNYMDEIDSKIISILKNDSRESFLEISRQLNVSEGTIRQRVKKLIDLKEIRKFTIEINQNKSAIIGLKINTKKNLNLVEKKLHLLGIKQIFHVSGRFDLMLETSVKGKELNNVLDRIRVLGGVEETETFMILEEC
jgi:DNA-binding Lrp family transcriptional regulator